MTDSYDLDGTKILLCINVKRYPPDPETGRSCDRDGSEKDEKAIIQTFKEIIYKKLLSLCNLTEFEDMNGVFSVQIELFYPE